MGSVTMTAGHDGTSHTHASPSLDIWTWEGTGEHKPVSWLLNIKRARQLRTPHRPETNYWLKRILLVSGFPRHQLALAIQAQSSDIPA